MSETSTSTTEATVTPQRAKGAKKAAASTKNATRVKSAPRAKKTAKKQPAPKAKAGNPNSGTREGSKAATVLEMLRRPEGATLKEIMAATNWQSHSVRGFISGTLGKKQGIKIESTRRDDGERQYQIV